MLFKSYTYLSDSDLSLLINLANKYKSIIKIYFLILIAYLLKIKSPLWIFKIDWT